MKFWVAIGLSVAAVGFASGAMADPSPARPAAGDNPVSARQMADAIVQVADAVEETAQHVAAAAIASPAPAEATAASLAAGQAAAAGPRPVEPTRANAAAARHAAKDQTSDKTHARASVAARRERLAEAKPMTVRPVGRAETGTAAWYGGRYVGRRTSSGERLDTVHATAAHRTLPLNCLVRVTNLRNGRSIVARVTDRGPFDDDVLIDMSPRAADELRMKEAGLVPVRIEQVVAVPADAK